MNVIHKHMVPLKEEFTITTYKQFWPISFQVQDDRLCLWAIVDTNSGMRNVTFCLYGTGNEIRVNPDDLHFIGTVQQYGFVWHLFKYNGNEE